MRYDRYGDAYDSARAWVDGRGAPDEWRLDGEGPEVIVEEAVDDVSSDVAGDDLVEEGVVAGLVGDHGGDSSADSSSFVASHDDYMDPGLFDAQMMVMEAQNNASMAAISGIGGYHDMNYNGYIDTHDLGMSNTYHSMG